MNTLKKTTVVALALASLAAGYNLIRPASAQSHDEICLQNYNQCLKGCDGAQSCNDQCRRNYDGCLQQGR